MAQRSQRGKRKDERSTEDGMALSACGWSVALLNVGRPVKFSNSRDADDSHTIRKRMPRPFQ